MKTLDIKFIRSMPSYKLYVGLGIMLAVGVLATWYYNSAMSTKAGNINIAKIKNSNRIYSYSVFADFYFRQMSFDAQGEKLSEYAELIPVSTNVGYDFDAGEPEFILRGETTGKQMVVDEISNTKGWTLDERRFIDTIRKFSREYGILVASQDQDVLDNARELTQKIQNDLFGAASDVPRKVTTDFLEDKQQLATSTLAIDNLTFEVFNLDYIPQRLQSFESCEKGTWCKNIWLAKFNERDAIYFQYLDQYRYANIDELVGRGIEEREFKDSLVVRTVRPSGASVAPVFFVTDLKKNKISSWYLDPNGYAYILVFHAANQQALTDGLADFLKIAYGVKFVPLKKFNNQFATEQKEVLEEAGQFVWRLLEFGIITKDLFPDDKLSGIESAFMAELDQPEYSVLLEKMSNWPDDEMGRIELISSVFITESQPTRLRFDAIDVFERYFGSVTDITEAAASARRAVELAIQYKNEVERALDAVKNDAGWKVWQDSREVLGELCQDRECLVKLATKKSS